jgi:hypothetical protein
VRKNYLSFLLVLSRNRQSFTTIIMELIRSWRLQILLLMATHLISSYAQQTDLRSGIRGLPSSQEEQTGSRIKGMTIEQATGRMLQMYEEIRPSAMHGREGMTLKVSRELGTKIKQKSNARTQNDLFWPNLINILGRPGRGNTRNEVDPLRQVMPTPRPVPKPTPVVPITKRPTRIPKTKRPTAPKTIKPTAPTVPTTINPAGLTTLHPSPHVPAISHSPHVIFTTSPANIVVTHKPTRGLNTLAPSDKTPSGKTKSPSGKNTKVPVTHKPK